jgi:hypothetical protein
MMVSLAYAAQSRGDTVLSEKRNRLSNRGAQQRSRPSNRAQQEPSPPLMTTVSDEEYTRSLMADPYCFLCPYGDFPANAAHFVGK